MKKSKIKAIEARINEINYTLYNAPLDLNEAKALNLELRELILKCLGSDVQEEPTIEGFENVYNFEFFLKNKDYSGAEAVTGEGKILPFKRKAA